MIHSVRIESVGSRALGIATAVLCGLLMTPAIGAEEYGEPIVLRSVNPEIDRLFGTAVAVDGDTLAIGVPESPEGGVAYVYERRRSAAGGWRLVAMVSGINDSDSERFGSSVTLAGETLVVGSSDEESRAYYAGAAYVFYRSRGGPSKWGRVRTLAPRWLEEYSYMGKSVSISGDLVAVGAPGMETVFVHERHWPIRNGWEVRDEIENPTPPPSAIGAPINFGEILGLSGKTLAVGARKDFKYSSPFGELYVFDLVEDPAGAESWEQAVHYDSSPGFESDWTRYLSLDAGLLLVGGSEEPTAGPYVLERNRHGRNRWGLRTELRDPGIEMHEVGNVAVRGKTAAVAAAFRSLDTFDYGHGALVFERHVPTRDGWGAIARLTSPEATEPPRSVAIGPREVVTGYPEAGVVLVFPRAPLVSADFEEGETTGLSWATGNVEVVSPGLEDTDYALEVTVDGTSKRSMVRARQPHRDPSVSLGFNLAANRVDLADQRVEIMNLYGPARDLVRLTLEADPVRDQYWARLWAWDQGDGWREVDKARMPPKRSVRMDVEWRAATGPGHDNGRVRLRIDGRLKAHAGNLDTDRQFVNGLLLGLPKGSQGTAGGAFLLDQIELHR